MPRARNSVFFGLSVLIQMVFTFDVLQLPTLSCLWEGLFLFVSFSFFCLLKGLFPCLTCFRPKDQCVCKSMCIHTYRRKCLGISTIVYGGALGNQRMFCTAGVGCLPQGVENLSQVAMAADT